MYSPDIEQKCANCQNGTPIAGTFDVICKRYGIVAYDYVCKKYKYDIFKKKITPTRIVKAKYDAKDFSLE